MCKNSKLLGNFAIYCENGRTKLRLAEQIYNRIRIIAGFDLGTQYTLATKCGLDRRNIQFLGILGLSRQPKISWFNFLVDLKEQSTQCEKNCTVRIFLRMFKLKNDVIRNDSRLFETA